jgi:lantibiotic modifying enzyme
MIEKDNWKPIFSNIQEKERIEKTIFDLSIALSKIKCPQPGLFIGDVGLSLFYGYLFKYTNKGNYQKQCVKRVANSLNKITSIELLPSFESGISGICWGLNHLIQTGVIKEDFECIITDEINQYLSTYFNLYVKKNNYDYFSGALGIALNFLDYNKANSNATDCLKNVISYLKEASRKQSIGIAWETPFKEGYNLGLSHGIPSIIVILAKLHKQDINKNATLSLLRDAINWIISQADLTSLKDPVYKYSTITDGKKTKLAWCYGDLGVAIALLQAYKATGNTEWLNLATALMKKTESRKEEGVEDAQFCHGSVGIAHIYNRFYQVTGIESFRECSKFWYIKTLEYSKFEDGIAGYKSARKDSDYNTTFVNAPGLLEGCAGIGLSLLSSISSIEPKWDSCFLLS